MTNDSRLFLSFLVVGVVIGALWGLTNHIVYWAKHRATKHILRFIFDLFTPITTTLFIITISNNYNFGQIRWFFVVGTLIGFIFERKTIGKMFAKLNTKLYNNIQEKKTRFLSTKLGRKLTK